MSSPSLESSIPQSIVRKLHSVRRHKVHVQIACALIAALAVLLAGMGVAMLVDWLATLYDSRLRVVLTAAALVAATLTMVGWIAVAWRRLLGIEHVAGDVDREIPQLEERWTTLTRLGPDGPASNTVHPAMLRRVAAEAATWEPRVEPAQVVSLSTLIRTLLGLTAVTTVLAIAVLIDARQTLVLVRRFWAPASSISATQLVDASGDIVVGRGEPAELRTKIDGVAVEQAMLLLSSADEADRSVNLVARGSEKPEFTHRVRAVEAPFKYRFRAGDGQTEWFSVDVADRPEIKRLQVVVTPPAYTRRPAETFDHLPRRISAMHGSTLELTLWPKTAVVSAVLSLGDGKKASMTAEGEGGFRWSTTLEQALKLTPTLVESHGLTNLRTPTCDVVVYQDSPPEVKVLAPDDEMAVRPDDTIEISFAAKDDVGIKGAELVVYESPPGSEPVHVATIPIPLDTVAKTAVQETVALDLSKFAAAHGTELSYEIRVLEDRGQPAEAEGASPPKLASGAEKPAAARKKEAEASSAAANSTPSPRAQSTEQQAATDQKSDAVAQKPPAAGGAATQARDQLASANAKASSERTKSTDQMAKAKDASPPASTAPRTATSERKGIIAGGNAEETQQAKSTSKDSPRSISSQSSPGNQQSAGQQQAGGRQQSSSASQTAATDQKPSASGDQPPGDEMPRRGLDVPQSSTSQRMRLKVDQWSGSFSGQQRAKLEMAIEPELEALDQALAKAQSTASGVLDQLAAEAAWRASHDREVGAAEKHAVEGQRIIDSLEKRSKGTPYAFVGLQVVEIGIAHVEPARSDFWTAIEANDGDRAATIRDAVQHLTRARELLNDLRGRFERTRREMQMAESVEQVKKMYQVFVENSLALLQTQDSDPQRYNRKMAEFDLDDEYRKRLKEVLEMRAKLQAELARILANDPRLLRRFMDSLRNRANNLREELAALVARQSELNREVRAWAMADESARPDMARTLMLRHAMRAGRMATEAGKLQDRYETWLPLNRESQDADLLATTKLVQESATAASEMNAKAQRLIAAAQEGKTGGAPLDVPDNGDAPDPLKKDDPATIAQAEMVAAAERLYERLSQLNVALRQIAARDDDPESATFAAMRLVDVRRLIEESSAWLRQMKAHEGGTYLAAAEVEQYRLATTTEELAGKLGSIEQSLSGMLQRPDGSLPAPIAAKAREFLATLDREAAPNQLAAVYALHSNQLPRAQERQQTAASALAKAETLYDELMKLAIAELDKLPVQDPIADLLDDPTLDELLAQLEQELPLAELLGIPLRPSNLRIIYDWMQPGSTGGGGGGGAAREMAANQVRQDEERARRRLDEAYRRALARALKEKEELPKVEPPKSTKLSDWNRLVSKLGDDLRQGRDKAPPEQYRRAIEQYFSQISRESLEVQRESGK